MLSRAALLSDQGQDWVVEQIDVDPPLLADVPKLLGLYCGGVITYG